MVQKTIAREVRFSGKGMHSGTHAEVVLRPGSANEGFRFRRVDGKNAHNDWIVAAWDRVVPYPACTCIGDEQGQQVRTIEHLMAACYATGIHNLDVEVAGEEIPILDGSAQPIAELLEEADVQELQVPAKCLRVTRTVEFCQHEQRIKFSPASEFEVDINIYGPEFGCMRWHQPMSPEHFRKEIVHARAWGRLRHTWIPKIVGNFTRRPILRGAGLNTATVLAFGKPINPHSMVHGDDLVRHKVLDIVGDLQLLKAQLRARVECHSSAHVITHAGMRTLMQDRDAWRLEQVPA